jgi:hypothetical protein
MIIERISLGAIYNSLLQLETNEGKVYDIVLNYKLGKKTISPPVFKDLEGLRTFINKNYPYIYFEQTDTVCTWNSYKPVKFWVEKNNGIQVQFKELLNTTKGSLYSMSEKKLRGLNKYINQLEGYVDFDNYIAPSTPTYVECIYIDDVLDDSNFGKINTEYKKYTRL